MGPCCRPSSSQRAPALCTYDTKWYSSSASVALRDSGSDSCASGGAKLLCAARMPSALPMASPRMSGGKSAVNSCMGEVRPRSDECNERAVGVAFGIHRFMAGRPRGGIHTCLEPRVTVRHVCPGVACPSLRRVELQSLQSCEVSSSFGAATCCMLLGVSVLQMTMCCILVKRLVGPWQL